MHDYIACYAFIARRCFYNEKKIFARVPESHRWGCNVFWESGRFLPIIYTLAFKNETSKCNEKRINSALMISKYKKVYIYYIYINI